MLAIKSKSCSILLPTLAIALAISPLGLGCKGKEEKSATEEQTATTEPSAPQSTAQEDSESPTPREASPSVSSEELSKIAHFPKNTEAVLGLSMDRLMKSELWKEVGPAAVEAASEELGKVQKHCGFDPLKKLKQVHVGVDSENPKRPLLLVEGFTQQELRGCIETVAKVDGEKLEISEEGKVVRVHSEDRENHFVMAWLDTTTMLMLPEGAPDAAYLEERTSGKGGLGENAAFIEILGKTQREAPLWLSASFREDSDAAKGLAAMGQKPAGIYASFDFQEGIDIRLGLAFADEKAASDTENLVRSMLPMLKQNAGPAGGFVDKLKLAVEEKDMVAELSLSKAELQTLTDMAGRIVGK